MRSQNAFGTADLLITTDARPGGKAGLASASLVVRGLPTSTGKAVSPD